MKDGKREGGEREISESIRKMDASKQMKKGCNEGVPNTHTYTNLERRSL